MCTEKISRLGKGIGKTLATLATAGALTLGLGASEKARAGAIPWISGSEVFEGVEPPYSLVDYSTTVTLNGNTANQNMALIYMMDIGNGVYAQIAEIDVTAGSTTGNGKVVKDDANYYGLLTGQNLNNGTAPSGYWNVFYDLNNNSQYSYSLNGTTHIEGGENLNGYPDFSVSVSGQPNFNGSAMSGGLINVTAPVPEPSTIGLVLTGLGALAYRRRRDIFKPKSKSGSTN